MIVTCCYHNYYKYYKYLYTVFIKSLTVESCTKFGPDEDKIFLGILTHNKFKSADH